MLKRVKQRFSHVALGTGALIAGACSVYGVGDLPPADPFGQGGHSAGGASSAGNGGSTLSGGAAPLGGKAGSNGGSAPFAGAGAGGAAAGSNAGGRGGESTLGGAAFGGATASGGVAGSAAGGTTSGSGGANAGSANGGVSGATTSSGGSVSYPPELIDNMEDGDNEILINAGRNGYWYTAADIANGAAITPTPGGNFPMEAIPSTDTGTAPGSTKAFHMQATPGAGWGAMGAFDFLKVPSNKIKVVYDARAFKGIAFYAKASSAVSISLRIPIKATSTDANGDCLGTTKGCDDHYACDIPLTTSWKLISKPWSSFQQAGWGNPASFDLSTLVSTQFVVTSPGSTVDVWIDDVAFTL